MKFITVCVVIAALLLVAGPVAALEVRSVEFARNGPEETIVITLSGKASQKLQLLSKPERLVVDIPSAKFPDRADALKHYKGRLVKNLRFGNHTLSTSRLVFDLTMRPESVSSTVTPDGDDTKIEIVLGKAKQFTAPGRPEPEDEPREDRPMIIIDPGHGGQDPGAIGSNGIQEKDITLAIARKLKDELLVTGRYQVELTRSDDRFILLRDRFKIARKQGAKLFISLHVNSAPNGIARGISVYSLSDKASDVEAAALAARENKADLISGMDLNGASPDVTNILLDLAEHETRSKSESLAKILVRALGRKTILLENAHRSADFAVLKAPDIPSVLIETGFITNAREEKLLGSDDYQNKLARGMADGIDAYLRKRAGVR